MSTPTFEELNARIKRLEDELSHCIELPKDADGAYIHIGDRMVGRTGNFGRVAYILLTDGRREPSVYLEISHNDLREHSCNEISHYHGPTVEDVLEEYRVRCYTLVADLELKNITSNEYEQGIKSLNAEYAAKLSLAEDGKGQ